MVNTLEKIELVGLPGSGKTTYINKYCKNSPATFSVKNINRVQRLYYGGLFFCYHPFISERLVRLMIREYRLVRHPGLKHKFFFLLLNTCAREFLSRNKSKYILDEGLCQFVFSMYERVVCAEMVAQDFSFLIKYKKTHQIIFMEASEETRLKRYRDRGRKFRQITGHPEYNQEFSRVVEKNSVEIKKFFKNNFSYTEIYT